MVRTEETEKFFVLMGCISDNRRLTRHIVAETRICCGATRRNCLCDVLIPGLSPGPTAALPLRGIL